jgi:hypothetical protein
VKVEIRRGKKRKKRKKKNQAICNKTNALRKIRDTVLILVK